MCLTHFVAGWHLLATLPCCDFGFGAFLGMNLSHVLRSFGPAKSPRDAFLALDSACSSRFPPKLGGLHHAQH